VCYNDRTSTSQEKKSVVDFSLQWPSLIQQRFHDCFVLSFLQAELFHREFPEFFNPRFEHLSNCVIIPGHWVTLTIDEHDYPMRQQAIYDWFRTRLLRRRVIAMADYFAYDSLDMFKSVYGDGLISLYNIKQEGPAGFWWRGFYVPKMIVDTRKKYW
jgi:hypothetical protein